MLFASHAFLLAFLPATLAAMLVVGRAGPRAARSVLLVASLVFYGWWSVWYLALLVGWIAMDFGFGRAIGRLRGGRPRAAGAVLGLAVAVNLGLLGYFKYATFVVDNVAALTGVDWAIGAVVLPLAVSFHTFQQIAYLVDCRRSGVQARTFAEYLLYVAFFPQLIAGPIVLFEELAPQIRSERFGRLRTEDAAAGLVFLALGLAKKLLLADPLTGLAAPVFDEAAVRPPDAFLAWRGVAAYSLGLYFDFSAYSDMAVGIARIFGVRLPYNFASPYRAASIVDFWQRWHVTLSRWLRAYVYVPIGGNRKGPARRYGNLVATMLLGGLWHGASWTFVAWGGLHGLYLAVAHGWRAATRPGAPLAGLPPIPPVLSWALTMAAVAFAWIFFRAPDFEHALLVVRGLAGLGGTGAAEAVPAIMAEASAVAADRSALVAVADLLETLEDVYPTLLLPVAAAIAAFLPNSQDIVDGAATARGPLPRLPLPRFRPTLGWAAATAALLLGTLTRMTEVEAFVYFRF